MSRVKGFKVSQESHPCGRLYLANPDYDSGAKVGEFLVPSLSRPEVVWAVELDFLTGETGCACEAYADYRNARAMPYRMNAAGAPLEHLAKQKGYFMLPLITRAPRGMCPHVRKVRAWLQRRGMMAYFTDLETHLIERLDSLPAKNKRKSA